MASTPEAALVTRLKAHAGFAAVCGDRLYAFGGAPDNPRLPACLWEKVNGGPIPHMGGATGDELVYFVLRCAALTQAQAMAAANAARACLDCFRGTVTVGADEVMIESAFLEEEKDEAVGAELGANQAIFQRVQKWRVFARA